MRPFSTISRLFFIFLILAGCSRDNRPVVDDLLCENLVNPTGIGKEVPRFSWKVKSDRNGAEQVAYRIMVSTDPMLLKKEKPDLWDSGEVKSPESVLVPYGGGPLKAGLQVYWKVCVWDDSGAASAWSRVAEFGTGLKENDWQASYIGFPSDKGFSACPQFRKSFELDRKRGRMNLHVNSLGYHEVYINGEKAGNGVLAPAVSQFNKRSQVITYDVSSLVKKGRNTVLIWLGGGWYRDGLPGVTGNGPAVRAQLEQVVRGESRVIEATGSSWEGRNSEYNRIGGWKPGNFGGEELNATRRTLDLTGNGQESWSAVKVVDVPLHEATPQMVEHNQIRDTVQAVSVIPLNDSTWLADMGINLTGWIKIRFPPLQKSQAVQMDYCDHLDDKGGFVDQRQTDRYIASGEGEEVFINKFNYHGFRYVKISNLREAPDKSAVTGYLIHTGYRLASGFQCSDPDLNKIHDMIFYTLRCLSLGGDLVDCPQLERLGYGGDGNASTQTAQTMFDLHPLYANWLQAWGDVVREDGGMPHTAPNPYPAGGGPYWCAFIITASWKTYLNYGDREILERYYPVMQKWLEYVAAHSSDGLLKRWPDTDYRGWYLGDWACPTDVDQTAPESVDLVNNCCIVECYDCMTKIAGLLGKGEEAGIYSQKRDDLRKLVHRTFFDASGNLYGTGTQIDLAYPLLTGVVPEEASNAVKQSLENETMVNRNGHLACGLVGVPILTEWAVKNQAVELMYAMLKKRDYPGYLYMIDQGATATWEHWNGHRSHIHNCYNGIGSWLYQAVGGICLADDVPAYRKVYIRPQIPGGVTWAKTFRETPYGKLSVNWELKDKEISMELEIPVGTEAIVQIPSGVKKYRLGETAHELAGDTPGMVQLKSGKYSLSY